MVILLNVQGVYAGGSAQSNNNTLLRVSNVTLEAILVFLRITGSVRQSQKLVRFQHQYLSPPEIRKDAKSDLLI